MKRPWVYMSSPSRSPLPPPSPPAPSRSSQSTRSVLFLIPFKYTWMPNPNSLLLSNNNFFTVRLVGFPGGWDSFQSVRLFCLDGSTPPFPALRMKQTCLLVWCDLDPLSGALASDDISYRNSLKPSDLKIFPTKMVPALNLSCLLLRKRQFCTLLEILQIRYRYSDRCLPRDLSWELQVHQGRWQLVLGNLGERAQRRWQLCVGRRTEVLFCWSQRGSSFHSKQHQRWGVRSQEVVAPDGPEETVWGPGTPISQGGAEAEGKHSCKRWWIQAEGTRLKRMDLRSGGSPGRWRQQGDLVRQVRELGGE